MAEEATEPHRRRKRYKGSHPRAFAEKYKELDPERYPEDIEKVMARGDTPAGSHRSICVREVLEVLAPRPGELAADATLGHGGHALELLKAIQPGGRLYGLDRDPLEIAKTEARLRAAGFDEDSFVARRMNFAQLPELLAAEGLAGLDMVLADLGVSSMQIDNPERGFTFKRQGPLDMRMDPGSGQSAAELLASIPEARLRRIIEDYSDESEAPVIARVLTQRRGTITTTRALAQAIRDALASRMNGEELNRKIIRRTFQALRIEVNGELDSLDRLLAALPSCLRSGGRAAILCFHSGEEGRVELAFRQGREKGLYSSAAESGIRPGPEERYQNPRSSSARLWWAVRA
ncbi:MAG TPA: 16S rRNA (cytosine(1402)-N(4))-methyltransferase RsmH [Rectinemataceae bacterium]|nr:16S rRNA (cytosine(1402)-N(4))-methyltransferase RsmH [Rectinemataceae bacterium]